MRLPWGIVDFDDEDGVFFGKVINLSKDGVTFQGTTAEELRSSFRESVDDYLSWCAETGRVALAAAKLRMSLNKFVEKALRDETASVV